MPDASILTAAITLIMSGAVTREKAERKLTQICKKLVEHEDDNLRKEHAIMLQCVEFFDAREIFSRKSLLTTGG